MENRRTILTSPFELVNNQLASPLKPFSDWETPCSTARVGQSVRKPRVERGINEESASPPQPTPLCVPARELCSLSSSPISNSFISIAFFKPRATKFGFDSRHNSDNQSFFVFVLEEAEGFAVRGAKIIKSCKLVWCYVRKNCVLASITRMKLNFLQINSSHE